MMCKCCWCIPFVFKKLPSFWSKTWLNGSLADCPWYLVLQDWKAPLLWLHFVLSSKPSPNYYPLRLPASGCWLLSIFKWKNSRQLKKSMLISLQTSLTTLSKKLRMVLFFDIQVHWRQQVRRPLFLGEWSLFYVRVTVFLVLLQFQ